MSKISGLPKRIALLLFTLALVISVNMSPMVSAINHPAEDSNDATDNQVNQQRRTNGLDKLRYFLLTSNPVDRAAKREEQNLYKRELIREYLQSADESNPNEFLKIKKRFKSFCHSYEDVMQSDRNVCG